MKVCNRIMVLLHGGNVQGDETHSIGACALSAVVGVGVDVEGYAAGAVAAEHVCLVFVREEGGGVGFLCGELFCLAAPAEEEGEGAGEEEDADYDEDCGGDYVCFCPVGCLWVGF